MKIDRSICFSVIREFAIALLVLFFAGFFGGALMPGSGPGSDFPFYLCIAAGAGVIMLRKALYLRIFGLLLLAWSLWGASEAHDRRMNARQRIFDRQIEILNEGYSEELERLELQLKEK